MDFNFTGVLVCLICAVLVLSPAQMKELLRQVLFLHQKWQEQKEILRQIIQQVVDQKWK